MEFSFDPTYTNDKFMTSIECLESFKGIYPYENKAIKGVGGVKSYLFFFFHFYICYQGFIQAFSLYTVFVLKIQF